MPWHVLEVRGQLLVGVSSFFLPPESQGSHSVCQAWHLYPLNHLAQPSFVPLILLCAKDTTQVLEHAKQDVFH